MSDVFIHATAEVSPHAVIGAGTKIWHHAQVRERAQIGGGCVLSKNVYVDYEVVIGDGCKIQNNVSVYHGVTLEDEVFVGPSVIFTNDFRPRAFLADWKITPTLIRRGAALGAGCVIVCGGEVGAYAMVAAGAVVAKSVPAHGLAVGNPARVIGYVYRSGERVRPDHIDAATRLATDPASGETVDLSEAGDLAALGLA